MEEITLNSWMTFGSCIVFLIMLIGIIVFIFRYGRKQLKKDKLNELKYKLEYREIQEHIRNYPVDLGMYWKIRSEILRLENMKYQNPEKTAGLYTELICGRFLKIADGIAKNRLKNK